MPRPPKLRPDLNETAFDIARAATGEGARRVAPTERTEKNPEAVERGRKGGKKGGAARAKKLTPEQREEIAQVAALARWKKRQS